jgi:hypothetical protein
MTLSILWLVLSGCAVDRSAIRSDDHEQSYLRESADLYWDSVRWGDIERASAFIERPEDRVLFRVRLQDRQEMRRLTEASVLRALVIKPTQLDEPDAEGRWRTGEVLVRTEGYTLPAQIVKTEELTQEWYRTTAGWWLYWDEADAAE